MIGLEEQGTVSHSQDILSYADDIVLLAGTSQEMQRMLLICEKRAQECHMFLAQRKVGFLNTEQELINPERLGLTRKENHQSVTARYMHQI